eukprot:9762965-Alexandrium_andersonii.AAC.1
MPKKSLALRGVMDGMFMRAAARLDALLAFGDAIGYFKLRSQLVASSSREFENPDDPSPLA